MSRYESPLRDEQLQATRQRILEAAMRVLGRGVAELSVPAVAREAGVSVPTVYRHFGDKRGVVAALAEHLIARQGFDDVEPPDSPEALAELIPPMFRRVQGRDPAISAALASGAAREVRRATLERRRALMESALNGLAERLAPVEVRRLVDTYLLLTASEAIGFLRQYLGLSAEETASTAAWAVLALARGAATGDEGGTRDE